MSLALELNLFPSSQFSEPFSTSFKFFALFPKEDEADVQKGITVLPLKSILLISDVIGQAASPHQSSRNV